MLQAMKSYTKDMEYVLLEQPFKYGKNNKVVRSNQQEFTKAKSRLTKLNACEDELRSSMNEPSAVSAIYTLSLPKLIKWTAASGS